MDANMRDGLAGHSYQCFGRPSSLLGLSYRKSKLRLLWAFHFSVSLER